MQISNLFITSDQAGFIYSYNSLQTIIDEEKPDLVVFTGDIVSPDYETSYADKLVDSVIYLIMKNIPWVSTGPRDNAGDDITRL